MIIKARSITADHARNTLGYVDKEEKDHIFLAADGVDISSVKTMMEDFSLYSSKRVKNAFVTTVISPSVEDNLDQKVFENLLRLIQKELNLDNRQFYAVIHQNTQTPHIHLISNRIDFNGKVWDDHHIAWKCQTACQNICTKLNLTSAAARKGKYQGKSKEDKSEFHNQRSKTLKELKLFFKEVKHKAFSIDHVYDYLETKGVKIEITQFKNGLYGASFEYNNFKYKASEVDRLLSLIPGEQSYTANAKMQLIIDNNLSRFEGKRGQKEILSDLTKYPDRGTEFSQELAALNFFLVDNLNDRNRRSFEEDHENYLSGKRRRRPKQLGFKVQI